MLFHLEVMQTSLCHSLCHLKTVFTIFESCFNPIKPGLFYARVSLGVRHFCPRQINPYNSPSAHS